jgi:hypothetical protein
MGYRSEVSFVIQTDDPIDDKCKNLWTTFITEAKVLDDTKWFMSILCDTADEETKKSYEGWIEGTGLDMEKQSIVCYFSDVKWYDSFNDVQSVQALLELADSYIEDKHPLSYAFVRVGEDNDDVVHECSGENGYHLIRPVTYIDGGDEIRGSIET